MTSYKLGRDRNGNKVLRVRPSAGRGFSIQTLGNLPKTHRDGICSSTQLEVRDYVLRCGTEKQRKAIGEKGNE